MLVWLAVLVPFMVWELLGFLVRSGRLAHPTLSQLIKRAEAGRPWLRLVFALVIVVLFGHLVWPTF